MSKNIFLCSLLGLSSSSLSQLQNTNAISMSSSPFSFWSMTAFKRLRDPGPLPVENQPSLSIGPTDGLSVLSTYRVRRGPLLYVLCRTESGQWVVRSQSSRNGVRFPRTCKEKDCL